MPSAIRSAIHIAAVAVVLTPATQAEERRLLPGDRFADCADCPQMVVVPAGDFTMGSPPAEQGRYVDEGPQRRVRIPAPLAVGRFEVTRDQFAAFVGATGHDTGASCRTFEDGRWDHRRERSWRNPGFEQAGSHPVVCVNWHDANAYAQWLAARTGQNYRLLNEAEWEYAARAGSTAPYPFGEDAAQLCTHANGADASARDGVPGTERWVFVPCADGHAYTAPAGRLAANAFGLHDMLGNAWEWVEDCWDGDYSRAPVDGTPHLEGDCGRRMLRSGSWLDAPRDLRAAVRARVVAHTRDLAIGFRVARPLGQSP